MKTYKIIIYHPETWPPRPVGVKYAQGLKEARGVVAHKLSYSRNGKYWFAHCDTCGLSYMVEEV